MSNDISPDGRFINGWVLTRDEFHIATHALRNAFADAQEKMADSRERAQGYLDLVKKIEDEGGSVEDVQHYERMHRNFVALYDMFEDYARKFEATYEVLEERDAEIWQKMP